MEKNNNNIPTSLIVLLFIFCWPLGVVLLILKYSNKNTQQAKTYKNLDVAQNNIISSNNINNLKVKKSSTRIGAIIAFVFGALFFAVLVDYIFVDKEAEMSSAIIAGVITALCFGVGVFKWIKSVSIGNKKQKIEIYQNLIIVREIYSADDIASYLKISKIEVLDDVTNFIREGYLDGIRIRQNQIEKIPEYVDPNRIFGMKCPSCGATNKYIKGIENKCEYCGTILNLNEIRQ